MMISFIHCFIRRNYYSSYGIWKIMVVISGVVHCHFLSKVGVKVSVVPEGSWDIAILLQIHLCMFTKLVTIDFGDDGACMRYEQLKRIFSKCHCNNII